MRRIALLVAVVVTAVMLASGATAMAGQGPLAGVFPCDVSAEELSAAEPDGLRVAYAEFCGVPAPPPGYTWAEDVTLVHYL